MRPVKVRNDDQLVSLLRGRREAVGLTQGALDDRVGWADAYTAKLEAPHRRYGKRLASLFTDALFDWLQGLGLTLVLMEAREADALIAAHTAAEPSAPLNEAHAGRTAKRPALVVREMRTRISIAGVAQFSSQMRIWPVTSRATICATTLQINDLGRGRWKTARGGWVALMPQRRA